MVAWWNLFPGTLVVVAFGGIAERGFWKTSKGTNVRPSKQWHRNIVEVDKDRGLLGKLKMYKIWKCTTTCYRMYNHVLLNVQKKVCRNLSTWDLVLKISTRGVQK